LHSLQVVLMLVAAMSPDEAADGQQGKAKGASTAVACTPAAAKRMREAGQQLLSSLASEFPQALLYSTHMRWGLLLEVGARLRLRVCRRSRVQC